MRSLVVLFVLVLLGLGGPISVALAEDGAAAPAPEATSTAEDAETEDVVDDWTASIPVHAGFLWNTDREEWTQYINLTPISYRVVTLEVGIEVNPNEKDGPTGGLIALTYDLGNLRDYGVEVHWAEYFGVNVGPFLRWDFSTGEWQKGVLASVVDLSPIE